MAVSSQETLTPQIDAALAADPRTRRAVIEVIEDRGIVTLTGVVEGPNVRKAAEEIAARQPGVSRVNNELVVA